MRIFAIVLIVVGILMLIIPGVNVTRKEKVVDVGPIEINKKENKMVTWPLYAGAIVTVAGVVLLLVSKRK
jgi:preprotein translocase subunit SecE